MFDNKYADVKQIISRPFIIDSSQVEHIKNNVFIYFGVNEKILQNSFNEDEWNAFYEGKIEPFAIQLSLVDVEYDLYGAGNRFRQSDIFSQPTDSIRN